MTADVATLRTLEVWSEPQVTASVISPGAAPVITEMVALPAESLVNSGVVRLPWPELSATVPLTPGAGAPLPVSTLTVHVRVEFESTEGWFGAIEQAPTGAGYCAYAAPSGSAASANKARRTILARRI